MGAIGGASGALLGGLLTEALSWRWTLIINLPIGLIGAVAALHVVRAGRRDEGAARHFDLAGALTATGGLVVLTYGIVGTEQHGWLSARTLALLGLGAVLLVRLRGRRGAAGHAPARAAADLRLARALGRQRRRVLPRRRGLRHVVLPDALPAAGARATRRSRPGVAMLPMPITIAACTQVATRLTGRLGPGPVLAVGMTLIGIGMAAVRALADRRPVGRRHPRARVLASAGIGFSFVPVTIAATGGVRREESGLASGLVNTSRQMGGSVGLALLAAVATQHTTPRSAAVSRAEALTEGFHRAFLLGAASG